jgi:hypothetical protein
MKYSVALMLITAALSSGCAANVRKSSGENARLAIATDSSRHIVMNLTGSETAVTAGDWEQFKGEWRGAMQKAAVEAGVRYSPEETGSKLPSEPGTLVVVYVNDYRYISPGARYELGVMTGNAYIESKATFSDLETAVALGERSYNTSSSTWQGVFSAMTEKQVQAICKEIVAQVRSPT